MTIDIGDVRFTEGPVGTRVTEFGDQQTAKDITTIGETALAIGKGKALAELEGKSNIFEEVEAAPDTGMLDLTNITAARKQQNGISAEEARVRVISATKKAIANNPLFADEIRKDAKRFFQSTTGSSGIFTATSAEAMEAAAEKKRVMGQVDLELAANKVGLSVKDYIDAQGVMFQGQLSEAKLQSADYLSNATVEQIAEENTKVLQSNQLTILGELRTKLDEGGITPHDRAIYKNRVAQIAAASINNTIGEKNRNEDLTADDRKEVLSDIKAWQDNMNAMLDDAQMETIVGSIAGIKDNMVSIAAATFMPGVTISNKAGGRETVSYYLQAIGNKKKMAAFKAANPGQFKVLMQAGKAAEYFSSHLQVLIGENPSIPVPDASYKAFISRTMDDKDAPNELKDKSSGEIQRIVEEGEPQAISSYLNEGTRSWVMSKPENKKKLLETVTSMKNAIRQGLRTGGVPIDVYNLNVAEDGSMSFSVDIEKYQRLQASQTAQRLPPPQVDSNLVQNMELLVNVARKYPGLVLEGRTPEEYVRETLGEFHEIRKEVTETGRVPREDVTKTFRYDNKGNPIND